MLVSPPLLVSFGGAFDPSNIKAQIQKLEIEIQNPDFWQDQNKAKKVMQEKATLENSLQSYEDLSAELIDNQELLDIAEEDDMAAIEDGLVKLEKLAEQTKTECLFSRPEDKLACFLEINTGVGGNDASDFSSMLLRMYLRWAETHNFKTEIISLLEGEEAGIKSATIKIFGINACGWARTESGIHRLVRISPFNSNGKRQTSFSSVWVYPVADDNIEIIIEDKDLRVDTYRASGAGGQHVNKTDSAVRLTHLPTGIVAQCQNDRSQLRNKNEAMGMLKSRLYDLELQKQKEAEEKMNSGKTDNSWGNQIRSYVMHPYQMVKDLRTGVEVGNYQSVLDGNLDGFIRASLEKGI